MSNPDAPSRGPAHPGPAPSGPSSVVADLESRYGRRLAELSADLLTLQTARIDAGVDAGVAAIGDLAEAELVIFYDIGGETAGNVHHEYAWRRTGYEGLAPPVLDPDEGRAFRWSMAQLIEGRPVHIPRPAALPPEAGPERRSLLGRGVRSTLGVPILRERRLVGYLAIERHREEREFSGAEIELLRLAGGLLAGVIARKRAEEAVGRQLAFETRAAEVGRRLMTLSSVGVAGALRAALEAAAELAGAERAYLLAYPVGLIERFSAVQWCVEGVPEAEPKPLEWATPAVLRGETLYVPSVADLSPEQRASSGDLIERGVRSLLGFPIHAADGPIGFVGFETFSCERRWSDLEVSLLGLVGEFFASALGRKGAEDALRSSQTQLQQAQKMEAVGRLAGGIAHDFNNLLTVILGNSESLLERFEDGDATRADAEEIHRAAQRAASLTRQLLAFSSRPVEEPDRVDLGAVVEQLRTMLGRLLGGGDVQLVVRVPSAPCWAGGSASQVEQMLVNLVVNAGNAMPDGGTIEVEVGSTVLGKQDAERLRLSEGQSVATLRVADGGVGMDEETCARIFEPFFTTSEPGQGTGLGLSIVYSIVNQCEGAIEVHSRPGEGTVFDLFLPAAAPREATASLPPREAKPCHGTVLLVEDEKAVRRLGRRVLERGGCHVLEAGDGLEALEVARGFEGSIDLLVTDVVMPRMGGAELALRLRAEAPGLRVLYISGYPHGRSDQASAGLPPGEMLAKPFTGDRLLEKVSGLLSAPRPDRGET